MSRRGDTFVFMDEHGFFRPKLRPCILREDGNALMFHPRSAKDRKLSTFKEFDISFHMLVI